MTKYRFAIGVFDTDGTQMGFVKQTENPLSDYRYYCSVDAEFHESCVWCASVNVIDYLKSRIRDCFPDHILKTVEVAVTYKVLGN